MKPSSLIASRVVLRAACALGVAAATAVVSLDCGGKIGGTAADGGSASGSDSSGSSGGGSGGSSGGGSGSSSGGAPSSGSSSGDGTVCALLPGCQSTSYCPTACGGCSCIAQQWVCNEDPNCVADASPPPVCPPTPPGPGPCAPVGEMCTYPAMAGCVADCTCQSGGWAPCAVTCSTPPPQPCLGDAGLYGIDVPDSGIPNTSATLAGCYSCIENTCPMQFMACNTDCTCEKGVLTFLDCLASGTSALSCGMTLEANSGPNGAALLQCAAAPLLGGPGPGCLSQCGAAGVGTADASTTD